MTSIEINAMPMRHASGAARVKGRVMRAHLQWVRDHFGERTVSRVLAVLPARAVMDVNAALPNVWSPFESVVLLDRAIETVCGGATASTSRAVGRYTAHVELLATNVEPLRGRLHETGRYIARWYREMHDFARCTWTATSELSARLVLSNATASSRSYCTSMIGFCEQTLLMILGDIPLLREISCRCDGAAECVFTVTQPRSAAS